MEPKVIQMFKRLNGVIKETKTLYDITEAEMHFVSHIVVESASLGLSPKLLARLLRAAAHFVEASDDVVKESLKDI